MNSEDVLHVVPPIEAQHATNRGISNSQSNKGATLHEKRCNIGPQKDADLLHRGRLRINQAGQVTGFS